MKGMVACAVLAEIERRSGKRIPELFDLIGGTSVGGIVALSLCAGNSAEDTLGFFTADGPNIFADKVTNSAPLHELEGKGFYRYDPAPIEACLRIRMKGLAMKQASTNVIIPAFDRVSRQCVFFKSFDFETNDCLMWQVGRATSAAQTYFPPYRMDGWSFFDGGTSANNPSVCVHAQAVGKNGLWPGEACRMLFLGCGDVEPDASVSDTPGPVALLHESVDGMLASTDGVPDYQARQYMGSDLTAIQPKGPMPALNGAQPEDLTLLASAMAATIAEYPDEIGLFCQKPA